MIFLSKLEKHFAYINMISGFFSIKTLAISVFKFEHKLIFFIKISTPPISIIFLISSLSKLIKLFILEATSITYPMSINFEKDSLLNLNFFMFLNIFFFQSSFLSSLKYSGFNLNNFKIDFSSKKANLSKFLKIPS